MGQEGKNRPFLTHILPQIHQSSQIHHQLQQHPPLRPPTPLDPHPDHHFLPAEDSRSTSRPINRAKSRIHRPLHHFRHIYRFCHTQPRISSVQNVSLQSSSIYSFNQNPPSTPLTCRLKKTSPILSPTVASNFRCLVCGVALAHSIVLLLLNRRTCGRWTCFFSSAIFALKSE